MSTITQIEASIETLPKQDFFVLLGWMADQHLTVLSSAEFELPELEKAMLQALNSPRHPVNDEFIASIRTGARQTPRLTNNQSLVPFPQKRPVEAPS